MYRVVLVLFTVCILNYAVGWVAFSLGSQKGSMMFERHDPAKVTQVKLPEKDAPADLVDRIGHINRFLKLAHGNDVQGIATLASDFEVVVGRGLPPVVDVKYTFKGHYLSHLDCTIQGGKSYFVNFREDGSVSMYFEGTTRPLTGITLWTAPTGYPSAMQTVKDGEEFGLQLEWDKSGRQTKRTDLKTPRKIELHFGR